jgi:ubiquinone/menaquinone biosynthesis C-methylase UbiE
VTAPDPSLPWDTAQAADAYRDRDMRLARNLIFPTVLARLGSAVRAGRTVVDIGCGTGALTTHLAETRECTVQGLDPSAAMLDIARADRLHPLVHYRLFDGRSLEWIPDGSVDAVVCCLVYCTDPDDDRLAALTGEIRRVLRPAGPSSSPTSIPRRPGSSSPPSATATRAPSTPTATPSPPPCAG